MITTMWDHNKYMEYRKTNSLRNEFEKGSRDFALLVAAFTVEVVFVGLVAQLLNHYNLKKNMYYVWLTVRRTSFAMRLISVVS